jgi:hypothetical protein
VSASAAGSRVQLTLLTRAYCHLCDTMRDALMPIARRYGATVVEFDVDADPALEAAYGDLVPVLLHGNVAEGAVLCQFHLDPVRVADALAGNPPAHAGGA